MKEIIKKSLNRRDFLKNTATAGLAAAVIGAPAIVRGQNMNSKINLAMIGTGSRGGLLLRTMQKHDRIFVTDLCDIYPPNLKEASTYVLNNPKLRAYDVWEEVLEKKDVDAVMIAAPLHLHVPMSVASLDAGKHVYSEKSMALNMKHLNQICQKVPQHPDLVYTVGYQDHYLDTLDVAKNLIEEGSIGKVTQFSVHFDRNSSWKKENVPEEWERVLNWRLYKEYCGGVLTEVVTHEIDQVMYILGTLPMSASFVGKIAVYKDQREHHDSVMGTWNWDGDVIGFGTGHFSNTYRGIGWIIEGTHGTIVSNNGKLMIYWEKQARHLDSFGINHQFTKVQLGESLDDVASSKMTKPKLVEPAEGDTTNLILEDFCNCVLNGGKTKSNVDSARRPSLAALMAYESSMNGGKVVTMEDLEKLG